MTPLPQLADNPFACGFTHFGAACNADRDHDVTVALAAFAGGSRRTPIATSHSRTTRRLLCGAILALSGCADRVPDRVYTIGTDNTYPYHFLENGVPRGMVGSVIAEAARRRGIRLNWKVLSAGPAPSFDAKQTDLWPLLAHQPQIFPEVHYTRPYLRNSYVQVSVGGGPFRPPDGLGRVRKVASTGMRMVTLSDASCTRVRRPSRGPTGPRRWPPCARARRMSSWWRHGRPSI